MIINLRNINYIQKIILNRHRMRKRNAPHSPIGVIPERGYHSSISSPFNRLDNSIDTSATSVSLLRFPLLYKVNENVITSGGTSLLSQS